MKLVKNLALVSGLCSVLALGACEATVGGGGDASGDTTADATTGGGADATTGGDTSTGGGDTAAATGYKFVTIDGAPEANPDCTTTSAGADIDVVALYRGGKLVGVGKPGTVIHKEGATPKCPKWGSKDVAKQTCTYGTKEAKCHNDPDDVAGGLTTKMYKDNTPDTGYFGLSGGTVEVQIGACAAGTDIKTCDGKGAVMEILPGDELDIYEVDETYKASSKTLASGIAPDSCTCTAEQYELWVSKASGKVDVSLGKHTGSKGQIKVQ